MPNRQPVKAPFTYSKDHTPYYFGHYINQARHNAFMIMAELARQFEFEEVAEDKLQESPLFAKLKDPDMRPDEKRRIVAVLMRHFSFLRYFAWDPYAETLIAEVPISEMSKLLNSAFFILNDLRNFYSHSGREQDILNYRWKHQNGNPFPLQHIYQTAVQLLRPRYSYYTEEHLNSLLPTPENAERTPNTPAIEPFNERSLAFFICMFLQRDEISRFLSRLEGFQNSAELPRRALLDAYREMSCKLPQDKLESSDILLDMFNELARCPRPLYQMLSEEDRKKFDRTPEIPEEENLEQSDIPPTLMLRHSDRFPWFALRYFDDTKVFPTLRFHIHLGKFAQDRYLKKMYGAERNRVLHHPIRTFARWKSVDVTDLNRRLDVIQDPRERSRLIRNWKLLPESWQATHQGITSLRPEIEQFSTSYLLDSNSIGFRFLQPGEKEGFPEFSTEKDAKGRLKFTAPNAEPDAIISTYEFASLYLHQRLHGPENTERFIQSYIQTFRTFCDKMEAGEIAPFFGEPQIEKTPIKAPKDPKKAKKLKQDALERDKRTKAADEILLKEYSLRIRFIPDKYREYLLGYRQDGFRYSALNKLKEKRIETRHLLQDIGLVEDARKNLIQPPRSDRDLKYAPKSGNMAVYLTQDLIFFKKYDEKKGGKPNNDQYIILEAMLAYFGANKSEVRPYFKEIGLLGQEDDAIHPFLSKVNIDICEGILNFYEEYLLARLNYLENAIRSIDPDFGKKPGKKPPKKGIPDQEIRALYGHILRIDEKKVTERSYSSLPVFLPRGLFNEQNEVTLREKGLLSNFKEGNTINMVAAWSAFPETGTQPMYVWNRYVLPPGDSGERGEPIILSQYLPSLEKKLATALEEDIRRLRNHQKHILDREKEIRYAQALDKALWLMALDLAGHSEDWSTDFAGLTLSDIETVLTEEVHFHKAIENVVLKDRLTIRRYGELRRVLKDRRLIPILQHFHSPGTQVDHEDIKSALALFEKYRIPFFERAFKFEGIINTHFPEEVQRQYQQREKKNNVLSHEDFLASAEILLNGLEDKIGVSAETLSKIRNKLLHNEIPAPELFPVPLNTSSCTDLVKDIFAQTETFYNKILKLLNLPSITMAGSKK